MLNKRPIIYLFLVVIICLAFMAIGSGGGGGCGGGGDPIPLEPIEPEPPEPEPDIYANVLLRWEHNDDNKPGTVVGYRIYYRTVESGTYDYMDQVGFVTEHKVEDLLKGYTWCFAASAFNADDESELSDEVCSYIPSGLNDDQ